MSINKWLVNKWDREWCCSDCGHVWLRVLPNAPDKCLNCGAPRGAIYGRQYRASRW